MGQGIGEVREKATHAVVDGVFGVCRFRVAVAVEAETRSQDGDADVVSEAFLGVRVLLLAGTNILIKVSPKG